MLDKNGDVLLKPSPLKRKPGMRTTKGTAPMGAEGEGEGPIAAENAGMQEAVASQDGAAGGGEQVPMHGPESHAGMQGGAIGGRRKPFGGIFGSGFDKWAQKRRQRMQGGRRGGFLGMMGHRGGGGVGGMLGGGGGIFFKEQSAFKMRSGNTTPFKLMGSSPVKQGLIWNKKIEKQMKEGFKEKMGPKGKKTYVKPEKEGKGKYHYKKVKRAKQKEKFESVTKGGWPEGATEVMKQAAGNIKGQKNK